MSYSLIVPPTGMSIDNVSGLIQWTPTIEDVGDHTVTARVVDNVGAEDTQVFIVTVEAASGGGEIPPDPAIVAPPLDPTVVTTLHDSTAFLYSGSNPIQTGYGIHVFSDILSFHPAWVDSRLPLTITERPLIVAAVWWAADSTRLTSMIFQSDQLMLACANPGGRWFPVPTYCRSRSATVVAHRCALQWRDQSRCRHSAGRDNGVERSVRVVSLGCRGR